MSLEISLGTGAPVGEMWTCDARLCLTEDKTRVVPENTPEARFLWAIPGQVVPLAEAVRLGAVEAPKADVPDKPATGKTRVSVAKQS